MRAGRYFEIDVHIHWTFWILILFAFISSSSVGQALLSIAMVASVFFCVVLHEYGHALTARRFGIRTKDITLMPIGGMARLERMPEQPMQEFLVAIAGPLVNVAIAVAIYGLLKMKMVIAPDQDSLPPDPGFWEQLLQINLFLALFNLLPAFPMDGGRILRSLLATKFSYIRATEIAARVGRWIALLFAFAAIWNPMLLFLAAFIFVVGSTELLQVRMREMQRRNTESMGSWQWTTLDGQFDSSHRHNGRPSGSEQVIDAVDFRQVK